jgi:hypothetical protein
VTDEAWTETPLTWRERWWMLRGNVEYRVLRPLVCALFGHKWCEWDTLDLGPGGESLEYRVCDRCVELEER